MSQHRQRYHRKRRIRKKWHIVEFTEYGFEVSGIDRVSDASLDNVIDFAESRRYGFGGGGDTNGFSFFVTSLDNRSLTDDDREEVRRWFNDRMFDVVIGPLVDVWSGS